jgi:hypothetical protein
MSTLKLMAQNGYVFASRSAPIVSRALFSSELIQIRNCLQVLVSLEYTLEQSRVVIDNVQKIDKLLSDDNLFCSDSFNTDAKDKWL